MSIWVLTFEVNNYDQEGEYYLRAWTHKPNAQEVFDQVKDLIGYGSLENRFASLEVEHILSGGGRRRVENIWFNLFEQQ